MSPEWKTLTENILAHKPINESDKSLKIAIQSWYQEEQDMALKLSRELGVLVKAKSRNKESIASDIKYVIKHKAIKTSLGIRDSVSDLFVKADFEKKNVYMSVDVSCPETGTNTSKINWLVRQLVSARKKNEEAFQKNSKKIYIEASIKYARTAVTESLNTIEKLKGLNKSQEIVRFKLYVVKEFGRHFVSSKGFVTEIEKLLIEFYSGYVQHLENWKKPAPKIEQKTENVEVIESLKGVEE